MTDFWEYFLWFLTSSVKFFLAPLGMAPLYGFWPTLLVTTTGGWFGVLIFHFFGSYLLAAIAWLVNLVRYSGKKRKKFTLINKTVVRVKSRFGLWGVAVITPVLLSIPLGVVLSVRYFGAQTRNLWPFFITVAVWSAILTFFSKSISNLLISIGWL
ncbi:MAG: hypothetical protein ACFB10_12265 [Salibacteraceae bacterium]